MIYQLWVILTCRTLSKLSTQPRHDPDPQTLLPDLSPQDKLSSVLDVHPLQTIYISDIRDESLLNLS
jgi:hypothetical protein